MFQGGSAGKGFRAVMACGMVFFSAGWAEEGWKVNFGNGDVGKDSSAVALAGTKGLVLVAVAEGGGEVSQAEVSRDGQAVEVRLLGYDAVSRLCFFSPPGSVGLKGEEWAERAPQKEGTVLYAGRVEGGGKGIFRGWVKQAGGNVLPLALLSVDFPGEVPEVGTPLRDGSGKVVGVVFLKREGARGVYAVPAEAVHRVLGDISEKGRLVRGWLGVSLLVENEQPKIVRVWPNSPAADAGVREDDVIVGIGGGRVRDYPDVVNAFFYLEPGRTVDFMVVRGGRELSFRLVPSAEKPK